MAKRRCASGSSGREISRVFPVWRNDHLSIYRVEFVPGAGHAGFHFLFTPVPSFFSYQGLTFFRGVYSEMAVFLLNRGFFFGHVILGLAGGFSGSCYTLRVAVSALPLALFRVPQFQNAKVRFVRFNGNIKRMLCARKTEFQNMGSKKSNI